MIIKAQNLNLESKEKSKRILIIFNILLLTFIIFWFYIRKIQRDHIKILFFKENLLDKTIEDGSWETPTAHGDDTAQDYLTDEEQPAEYYQEISAIKRKKLYHDLMNIIKERKLFLDPEITQKEVIALLGTNKKYLFEAISQNSEDNFKSVLNRFRVNEAKKIIREEVRNGNTELPAELYTKAGFNSQPSYYRLFKEFTGLTPKEYAREYFRDIQEQRNK